MKTIFITTLYRRNAKDFFGMAISEDMDLLASASDKEHHWVRILLGLDDSDSNHHIYRAKYPEGYNLVFIDQYEFDNHLQFKRARQRAMPASILG